MFRDSSGRKAGSPLRCSASVGLGRTSNGKRVVDGLNVRHPTLRKVREGWGTRRWVAVGGEQATASAIAALWLRTVVHPTHREVPDGWGTRQRLIAARTMQKQRQKQKQRQQQWQQQRTRAYGWSDSIHPTLRSARRMGHPEMGGCWWRTSNGKCNCSFVATSSCSSHPSRSA